jgi:hypothetical protein
MPDTLTSPDRTRHMYAPEQSGSHAHNVRARARDLAQNIADGSNLPVPPRSRVKSSRLLVDALVATSDYHRLCAIGDRSAANYRVAGLQAEAMAAYARTWNVWGEHAMAVGADLADLRKMRSNAIQDHAGACVDAQIADHL